MGELELDIEDFRQKFLPLADYVEDYSGMGSYFRKRAVEFLQWKLSPIPYDSFLEYGALYIFDYWVSRKFDIMLKSEADDINSIENLIMACVILSWEANNSEFPLELVEDNAKRQECCLDQVEILRSKLQINPLSIPITTDMHLKDFSSLLEVDRSLKPAICTVARLKLPFFYKKDISFAAFTPSTIAVAAVLFSVGDLLPSFYGKSWTLLINQYPILDQKQIQNCMLLMVQHGTASVNPILQQQGPLYSYFLISNIFEMIGV